MRCAQAWQRKSCIISGSGSHTLKWRYVKDANDSDGDDNGLVDFIQWSGSPPRRTVMLNAVKHLGGGK